MEIADGPTTLPMARCREKIHGLPSNFSPPASNPAIAPSAPGPAPFRRISTAATPSSRARSAERWPVESPATKVDFRAPLKPQLPALAQQIVSPFLLVIETIILLLATLT